MDNSYEIAVIGAGYNGLITTMKLVQEGYSVVLLEKNEKVGGYGVTFERNGFFFDASLHFTQDARHINELMAQNDDQLDLLHLDRDQDFQYEYEGTFLPLSSLRAFLEGLKQVFPDQEENIEDFSSTVRSFSPRAIYYNCSRHFLPRLLKNTSKN